jgi:hypothetical protein
MFINDFKEMMDETMEAVMAAVPALTLPPPDISRLLKKFIPILISILTPPPDPLLDVRHRLLSPETVLWSGRDVFELFSAHAYSFFEITGESPDSFNDIVRHVFQLQGGRAQVRRRLSPNNRALLFLIWLRCYPTYHMLSSLFNISVTTIKEELTSLIELFHAYCSTFINWPTIAEWREMLHVWSKLPSAVGAIDGTSFEIYRPTTEPQELYYSGYRHYHAIHAQVIVDNVGKIRYIKCGFPGHQNDAQQYALLPDIAGRDLPFPDDCILLADKIYPNRHPVVTPFTSQQINRETPQVRRKYKKYNRILSSHRSIVERSIGKLKSYKTLSSVWRHPRAMLSTVVEITAGLVNRKDI